MFTTDVQRPHPKVVDDLLIFNYTIKMILIPAGEIQVKQMFANHPG
jgi:hypothetical protein